LEKDNEEEEGWEEDDKEGDKRLYFLQREDKEK